MNCSDSCVQSGLPLCMYTDLVKRACYVLLCEGVLGSSLRHAVDLLGLHQGGLVRLQDSEWRVVLKRCEDSGANVVLLLQEPNYCGDSHDSHHAENDQA